MFAPNPIGFVTGFKDVCLRLGGKKYSLFPALSDCSHQLIWTMNFLKEVSFNVPTPHLYGDNLGLLFWGSNHSFNNLTILVSSCQLSTLHYAAVHCFFQQDITCSEITNSTSLIRIAEFLEEYETDSHNIQLTRPR